MFSKQNYKDYFFKDGSYYTVVHFQWNGRPVLVNCLRTKELATQILEQLNKED